VITPGQAHDLKAYPALMAQTDADPKHLLADKGYDSDAVRSDVEGRGGKPLIPTKINRKAQIVVEKTFYRLRNRIERFINRRAERPTLHAHPLAILGRAVGSPRNVD
jgi:IS5 family transposase